MDVPIEKIKVISSPKKIDETIFDRTIDKDVANPIYLFDCYIILLISIIYLFFLGKFDLKKKEKFTFCNII